VWLVYYGVLVVCGYIVGLRWVCGRFVRFWCGLVCLWFLGLFLGFVLNVLRYLMYLGIWNFRGVFWDVGGILLVFVCGLGL